jgi:hypothetical protein
MLALVMMWALSATPTLDGVAHAPVAKAPRTKTGIEFSVSPGSVSIYIDDRKVGAAADVRFVPTKPGLHTVKLQRGEDTTELQLQVKKGEVVQFNYEF